MSGALLKLADEIERACKAPSYEARLGTIEGKMVVAALRQAASQGRAGGERDAIARIIYDKRIGLNQTEAEKIAFEKADAILALSPPVKTGCGDPSCRDPNCTYGQGPNLDPISDHVAPCDDAEFGMKP